MEATIRKEYYPMQPLTPALLSKTRKRWDRIDTLVFTLGSVACFIAATITFGVLGAAAAMGVVLVMNAAIWVLVA